MSRSTKEETNKVMQKEWCVCVQCEFVLCESERRYGLRHKTHPASARLLDVGVLERELSRQFVLDEIHF